ncbi:MAG: ABC transporter permease [Gemmatimonadetes bacterium]|nr:ABC transporter permease [Gemmatimonadota bacterium]
MIGYATRRLLLLAPVLLGVAAVAFVLSYLLPGDPARALAGERYREEDLARIRHELKLDRPLPVQFGSFVGRLVRGDLGTSFATGRPVAQELAERFPRTLLLATASMGLATFLGIALGVAALIARGRFADRLSMLLALGGISTPVFVSAILLLWLFALRLRWVPPSGYVDLDPRTLILPAVTLGVRSAAVIARMTRASLLDVLGADYVRTSRAKGLREGAVVGRHALRNALVPVITLIGLDFGSYLSGSVLTESIFAWPGVGQYALQAILRRDFPAIQGTVLFLSVVFVLANLAVDLAYGWLDPRIRHRLAARRSA